MKNLTKKIYDDVDYQVWNNIKDHIEDHTYVYIRDNLKYKIWLQVELQLQTSIYCQIKEELNEKLN